MKQSISKKRKSTCSRARAIARPYFASYTRSFVEANFSLARGGSQALPSKGDEKKITGIPSWQAAKAVGRSKATKKNDSDIPRRTTIAQTSCSTNKLEICHAQ